MSTRFSRITVDAWAGRLCKRYGPCRFRCCRSDSRGRGRFVDALGLDLLSMGSEAAEVDDWVSLKLASVHCRAESFRNPYVRENSSS